VLDLGSNSFRDPKVFWHAATRRWVMLVSLADEGCLRFYTATDLLHWSQTSEFCPELPGCKVWECPDLIPLPVPGEPGALAWLLKVDVFEGHPSGGSGALGWIGDFDGQCFVPRQARRWLDGGRDFYAALSFGAMPPGDERRVWLAWMNDHRYAKHTPTAPWRGAMTLPRELALQRAADGALRLLQQPLGALAARRDAALPLNLPTALPAIGVGLYTLAPAQLMPAAYELDIQLTFDTTPAAPPDAPPAAGWSLQLLASADEATVLAVDPVRGELAIDRRRSGWTTVEGAYAGRHALPWPGAQQRVQRLRVIVDTCSVEVFAGEGEAVITELVFPAREARALRLQVDAPLRALSATLWPLQVD
jgi:sucrose-6-phosphate hydrolase SacC (GH32 family)